MNAPFKVPALPRSGFADPSKRPRRWTQSEESLMIDMHWLDGCGVATIANRLARTEVDVGERIAEIKVRVRHQSRKGHINDRA